MTREELLRRYAAGERYFRGEDLSGADLSGANLYRVDLSSAGLPRADLTGADMTGATLATVDASAGSHTPTSGGTDKLDAIVELLTRDSCECDIQHVEDGSIHESDQCTRCTVLRITGRAPEGYCRWLVV